MYAIVEIAGQQYKVKRGDKIISNRLHAKEGDLIEFDKVLLIDDNNKVQIGTPHISGAKVAASVVSHFRGEKILVFKKKRRKGYQKMNGHRQELTEILIQGVLPEGGKVKELLEIKKKPAKAKESNENKEVKEVSEKTKKSTSAKKAAPKKASKKSVSKKEE